MSVKPNLTIDDIARELGVSKTTVSRAISGKGRISAATRERVQECIERHNYKPNAAAKSLAESRTCNLALALPRDFIMQDMLFMRQIMGAICDEACLLGYNVMLCLTAADDSGALLRTLDYRKVDGVIVTSAGENDPIVDLLTQRNVPFAALTPRSDGAELGRTACRELIGALNGESCDPKPLPGCRIRLPQGMI